jgi:hypothetical protein
MQARFGAPPTWRRGARQALMILAFAVLLFLWSAFGPARAPAGDDGQVPAGTWHTVVEPGVGSSDPITVFESPVPAP